MRVFPPIWVFYVKLINRTNSSGPCKYTAQPQLSKVQKVPILGSIVRLSTLVILETYVLSECGSLHAGSGAFMGTLLQGVFPQENFTSCNSSYPALVISSSCLSTMTTSHDRSYLLYQGQSSFWT